MEINTRTQGVEVEISHRQALQSSKDTNLEQISVEEKKSKKTQAKYPPPLFKVGQEIFINAFLKSEKGKFFVCKSQVIEIPQPNQRRIYKVKIIAIGEQAIGYKESTPIQATLLGRVITKRENEMLEKIADFMLPKSWIILDPNKQTE